MKYKQQLPAFIVLFLNLFALAGCITYSHLTVWSDNATDYSKYHSFAWLPDSAQKENLPYNNEVIRNNIRNYFGKGFVARGYYIDLDTPDVLLQVILTSNKKYFYVQSEMEPYSYCRYYFGSIYCTPYPVDYYYRHHCQYQYPLIYTEKKVDYIENSIILNVIDRQKNSVIWSANAKADVFDPVYINEHIHPAIEAIMRKYPVKPIKIRYKKLHPQTDEIYSNN